MRLGAQMVQAFSAVSPPTDFPAKVCTAAMSYINLPTVLPSSPSKTRGQIQVRGLGWGRVVAGAGCATGEPLKMTSLLGDFRAHVLREKVMKEWAFGAVGFPLSADPGSPLPPPPSSQKPLTRPQTPLDLCAYLPAQNPVSWIPAPFPPKPLLSGNPIFAEANHGGTTENPQSTSPGAPGLPHVSPGN